MNIEFKGKTEEAKIDSRALMGLIELIASTCGVQRVNFQSETGSNTLKVAIESKNELATRQMLAKIQGTIGAWRDVTIKVLK